MKPPKGYWGEKNEWEYFLHGPGCRLTNLDTGEPVQWDAPDLHRFDRSWFVHWVNWLMKQTHDETISTLKTAVEASNKILQTFIYELLEQLEEAGLITRADPYPVGYTLNF